MTKHKRCKVAPKYKQMAFETAVRNPERYKGILTAIQSFENRVLDNDTLLEIVSYLYLNGIVASPKIKIKETSNIKNISNKVIEVNNTRKADGGFPEGYASRFWTYMRTLSEMGFVYAQYNEPLRFSAIAEMLVKDELDEQEAFSIQAIKYNRKSPYRNILNNFNYFKFIVNILKKREKISYEQFIISTFSKNGKLNEFFEIIDSNTFNDSNKVENFLREQYNTSLKAQTILRDYPDVVLRLLLITGFISIQFRGKVLIYLNQDKAGYIDDLLDISVELSKEEKEEPELYFEKLETFNKNLLNVVFKHRKIEVEIDGFDYTRKVFEVIKLYKLDEELLLKSIELIGSPQNVVSAFKYIAEPLKLEFFISLLIALKYGKELGIRPNYKADYIGIPISHAPGNKGDIEVYNTEIYWLIEVTLIRNKTQQLNSETTSVIRHFIKDDQLNNYLSKYLSFVAPVIHSDTKDYYDYSIIKERIDKQNIYIKPYNIREFVEVSVAKTNFEDMKEYTGNIIDEFKERLNR
jgi:hypothetical protein